METLLTGGRSTGAVLCCYPEGGYVECLFKRWLSAVRDGSDPVFSTPVEILKYIFHRGSQGWGIIGILYRRTTPPHIDRVSFVHYCAARPLAYNREDGSNENREACCGGRCLSASVDDFSTVDCNVYFGNKISVAHIAKRAPVSDITANPHKHWKLLDKIRIVGNTERIW